MYIEVRAQSPFNYKFYSKCETIEIPSNIEVNDFDEMLIVWPLVGTSLVAILAVVLYVKFRKLR